MSYRDDYRDAKATGRLLDPMPQAYIQVRTLVSDEVLPDVLDGLTIGTDAWYNESFEVYVRPELAETIKERAE